MSTINLKDKKEYTCNDIIDLILTDNGKYVVLTFADYDSGPNSGMPDRSDIKFKIFDNKNDILNEIDKFLNNDMVNYEEFNQEDEYCEIIDKDNMFIIWIHNDIGDQVYKFVMEVYGLNDEETKELGKKILEKYPLIRIKE
jgi:hypothetical protein